jgi:carboxyl-terminal processing protease
VIPAFFHAKNSNFVENYDKMKISNIITALAAVTIVSVAASAQSKSFRLGQWVEIQNSILKEINTSYVDSLAVDRIFRAGIDKMLENIDPYTTYIPEEENEDLQMLVSKTYGGIGAVIHKKKDSNVIINEPYANSPAARAGLVCGDEILEVDGVSVKGLDSKQSTDRMKGKPGTTVVFKVKKVRTGDTLDVPVVRERIHLPDVEYAGMLDDTTGYILQSGFTENVSADIKANVIKLKEQGMKRLVLDLRGNGGGLLDEAVSIVSLFVPKGSLVVTAKGKTPQSYREYRTKTEPLDTLMPVIVMVDSGSASASEIVSGALQDLDRGVIMGRRTYGKGLVQTIRPVAYNGQVKITTAKYYTPSGRCVQAIDYSNRGEDGSVGHIPDSLTNEFKTLKGRTVRDGGGITPDVDVPFKGYSRLVYSLVMSGVVDTFVLEFVKTHPQIAALDEFEITDEIFDDFVEYAKTQTFDYRSSAKTFFDEMKKELEKDGLAETMSEELKALEKVLEMDKEKFIRLKKNEIIPFIEEEIVVRYYYQEAGVKVRLKYDQQLKDALSR